MIDNDIIETILTWNSLNWKIFEIIKKYLDLDNFKMDFVINIRL